jgi:predicted GIY-YIG superfamily endonuclease
MVSQETISQISIDLEDLNVSEGIILTAQIDISTHSKLLRQYIKSNFVYFILQGQEVVYVGSTINISARISQHRKDKDFTNILLIKYNNHENMYNSEKRIISKFNPKLNKKKYLNG